MGARRHPCAACRPRATKGLRSPEIPQHQPAGGHRPEPRLPNPSSEIQSAGFSQGQTYRSVRKRFVERHSWNHRGLPGSPDGRQRRRGPGACHCASGLHRASPLGARRCLDLGPWRRRCSSTRPKRLRRRLLLLPASCPGPSPLPSVVPGQGPTRTAQPANCARGVTLRPVTPNDPRSSSLLAAGIQVVAVCIGERLPDHPRDSG